MKLYNFVLRPIRAQAPKRARTGTGTGTGGLKRKSMDEDVEAEKIRQLEERMANGLSLLTVPAESHSRKENNKTRPDQRNPVVLRVVTRLKIS